jgi:hypothetical protein
MSNNILIAVSILSCMTSGCAVEVDRSSVNSSPSRATSAAEVKAVVISWKQDQGRISYFLNGEYMGFDEGGFEHMVNLLEKKVGTGSVYPIMNPQYVLPWEPSADVIVFPFRIYSSVYSRFLKMTHGAWALEEGPIDQVVKTYANDE